MTKYEKGVDSTDPESLMGSLKLSHGAGGSLRLKLWRLYHDNGKAFTLHIKSEEQSIYWRAETAELIELAKWILQCALIVKRGYRG